MLRASPFGTDIGVRARSENGPPAFDAINYTSAPVAPTKAQPKKFRASPPSDGVRRPWLSRTIVARPERAWLPQLRAKVTAPPSSTRVRMLALSRHAAVDLVDSQESLSTLTMQEHHQGGGVRSEAEVTATVIRWLLERGWDVREGPSDGADLVAKRGAERLVVEAKGHTSAPGLDVDTMFGQILRRIDPAEEMTRYAVAVPETLARTVERIDADVLDRLDIAVWLVDDFGRVRVLGDESSS